MRPTKQGRLAIAAAILAVAAAASISTWDRPPLATGPAERVQLSEVAPPTGDTRPPEPRWQVIARGADAGYRWTLEFARDEGRDCLRLTPTHTHCSMGGFWAGASADWRASSAGPGRVVSLGFVPRQAAAVRLRAGSATATVEPRLVDGLDAAVYVAVVGPRPRASLDDVDVQALDRRGEPLRVRPCGRDQYSLRLRVGGPDITLAIEGFRGPLPCELELRAHLRLERSGEVLQGVRGHPSRHTMHHIPLDRSLGLPWELRNWCGSTAGVEVVVDVDSVETLREPLSGTHVCDEPDGPAELIARPPFH